MIPVVARAVAMAAAAVARGGARAARGPVKPPPGFPAVPPRVPGKLPPAPPRVPGQPGVNTTPPAPLSKFATATGALTSGALTNALYSVDALTRFADRIAATTLPRFEHSITVTVKGGPEASMNRTWQLACAIAFGQYRYNIGRLSGVSMTFTWDLTAKTCQIGIYYQLVFDADTGFRTFLQRGPVTETVGGGWPIFLQPDLLALGGGNNAAAGNNAVQGGNAGGGLVGGGGAADNAAQAGGVVGGKPIGGPGAEGDILEVKALLAQAQVAIVNAGLAQDFSILPDDGRLILTEVKTNPDVQPPRPTDYYNLVSLVSNVLNDPGYLPGAPPPGVRFGNPEGARLFPVGQVLTDTLLAGKIARFRRPGWQEIVGGLTALVGIGQQAFALFFNSVGLDNYAKPGTSYQPSVRGPRVKGVN